jgi:phage-related protein
MIIKGCRAVMKCNKILALRFYKNSSGREPVKSWLKMLNPQEQNKIYENLRTLQRQPMEMPIARYLENNLWEVRTSLSTRKSRVIFAIKNEQIVLLHGFIKKTQKTPRHDIDLALSRWKEFNLQEKKNE